MQFPECWLRSSAIRRIDDASELADLLTMAGLEVETLRPAGAAVHRRGRGARCSKSARHPERRPAERVQGRCGRHRRAARDRLRRAQRARRHARCRWRWSAPSCRRVRTATAVRIKRRQAARRGEPGHAVLGARAGAVGRPRRPARAAGRRAGRARHRASCWSSTTRVHAQADAEPRRIASASSASRARSRRSPAHRCARRHSRRSRRSDDARLPVHDQAPDLCGRFSGRVIRSVEREGADAGLDGRAPGALRPAFGFGAGRHLQLRDVRARPAVARLRPRQDPRRPRRALGQAGETLKLLNGSTVEVDETVGVIADAAGVESLAGIMGGDADGGVRRHAATSTSRPRSGGPRRWPGRSRRYNFTTDAGHRFERGVDPATTVDHIERITRLILEICGGRGRPDCDDQVLRLPRARAGDAARRARGQGHRHAAEPARSARRCCRRLGLAVESERRGLSPSRRRLPLRPRDRGRPDRGGVARRRLRARCPTTPPRGADRAARAERGAAHAACAARAAGRARLPGNDQFQLRRGALGARARRQRRPDPRAQSDRQRSCR